MCGSGAEPPLAVAVAMRAWGGCKALLGGGSLGMMLTVQSLWALRAGDCIKHYIH